MSDIKDILKPLLYEYKDKFEVVIPEDYEKQKLMYNSLVSVRAPGLSDSVNEDFFRLQDDYLTKEIKKQGIVNCDSLLSVYEEYNIEPKKVDVEAMMKVGETFKFCHSDKICLYMGDIALLDADMIVDSTDSKMLGCFIPNHNCLDNHIHLLSGTRLREECYGVVKSAGRGLRCGEARVTKAYNLPAKYIAHTFGPSIDDVITDQAERELTSCCQACLDEAEKLRLKTVAFPLISTGESNYPLVEASKVILQAIDEYLDQAECVDKVVIVAHDEEAYDAVLFSIKHSL